MNVHLRHRPSDAHVARLSEVASLSFGPEMPDDTDVLVAGVPSEEDLQRLRPGAAFVIPFAGLPAPARTRLLERPDLRVYNLHHNADLVAEHAVALLLSANRVLLPMDAALRRGDWRPRYEPDPSPTLVGRRALILGYGAIGQRVGRVLQALGMEVRGLRRRDPLDLLDALLPETRALIVAVPHTPATEGLLDARRLALLPREAVLVNVARGAVVDEDALYAALSESRLHGAGLDVWWRYPDDDARDATPVRFADLDNVVLSPHRGGHARDTEDLRTEHLARLLATLARGEEPDSRVDVVEGY